MRMLLLLSILGFLFILANKSPDQSVWDAVQGIKGKAGDVYAKLKEDETDKPPMSPPLVKKFYEPSPSVTVKNPDDDATRPAPVTRKASRAPKPVTPTDPISNTGSGTGSGLPTTKALETETFQTPEPVIRKPAAKVKVKAKVKPKQRPAPKLQNTPRTTPAFSPPKEIAELPRVKRPPQSRSNNPPAPARELPDVRKLPTELPKEDLGSKPTAADIEEVRRLKKREKRIYDELQKILLNI